MWLDDATKLLESALGGLFPKEENRIDWKEGLSPNNKRLAEHISAFANVQGGGYLVFGIKSSGKNMVNIRKTAYKKIISKMSNICRAGVEPAVQIDHKLTEFRGKNALFIRVNESVEKPVHLQGKSIEESFIRSGGETRKMTRQEIRGAIVNSGSIRVELLPALSQTAEKDLPNFLNVDDYTGLLKRQGLAIESSVKLLKKNALIKSIDGGLYDITNLGMLICAKDFSLFGRGPLSVRVIKYADKTKLSAVNDKFFNGGYATSFEDIIKHVLGLLPQSEVIKEATRITTAIYPDETIRELLANALIHQDLNRIAGNVFIELFVDRMEITNPGKLLPSVKIDQLINAHPQSRNEILAKQMRMLGLCEERGSGIDRAVFAVEFYGLPPLDFKEGSDSFKAIIFAPKEYKEMSLDEKVRACYQHCSLTHVGNQKMTNETLRKRLRISAPVTASRIIREAVDRGLVRVGDPKNKAKRYTHYVPYWA